MSRGFSLIEVVVALLVLHVALLGVTSMLRLAAVHTAAAASTEQLVTVAEGALDSLRGVDDVRPDSLRVAGGLVRWATDEGGAIRLQALGVDGQVAFSLPMHLP